MPKFCADGNSEPRNYYAFFRREKKKRIEDKNAICVGNIAMHLFPGTQLMSALDRHMRVVYSPEPWQYPHRFSVSKFGVTAHHERLVFGSIRQRFTAAPRNTNGRAQHLPVKVLIQVSPEIRKMHSTDIGRIYLYDISAFIYSWFSHHITTAMLVPLNKEPCWCPRLIFRELRSIHMQPFSFPSIEKHGSRSRGWKPEIYAAFLS